MMMDYETIISKIIDSNRISRGEVEEKVQEKLAAMQDLISREGAAHMVANELNVRLFDNTNKTLKISQLQQGLNSVNIICKVTKVNEVRTFNKNNRQGRVGSLVVGDETGSTRVVVWDENIISLFKDIKEGDILKISNAYVKQNSSLKEIHLGGKAQLLINPENESIDEVKVTVLSSHAKKNIVDLKENEFVELIGTVVQIFEPRSYNSCPVCSKKVVQQDDKFFCQEHNVVPAKQIPIVNIFLDDGTGNIRAVLFRDNAVKLLNEKVSFEDIKKEVLGRQLIVKGKVNKNEMFNRLEFMVNSFEEAEPQRLIEELELA